MISKILIVLSSKTYSVIRTAKLLSVFVSNQLTSCLNTDLKNKWRIRPICFNADLFMRSIAIVAPKNSRPDTAMQPIPNAFESSISAARFSAMVAFVLESDDFGLGLQMTDFSCV